MKNIISLSLNEIKKTLTILGDQKIDLKTTPSVPIKQLPAEAGRFKKRLKVDCFG
jgi:hypothetical protein